MQVSRPSRRTALIAALVATIAIVVVVGVLEGGDDVRSPATVPSIAQAQRAVASAPAPLRRLYAEGNRVLELPSDRLPAYLKRLRGYPVVVNTWAEWCGPCREEFPILRAASARYGTRVAFLGLYVGERRDRGTAFLRQQPTVYPSLWDADGSFSRALEATSASPSTVFLDTQGRIVSVRQGAYPSLEGLEQDLRRYAGLDGRPAPDADGIERPGAAR